MQTITVYLRPNKNPASVSLGGVQYTLYVRYYTSSPQPSIPYWDDQQGMRLACSVLWMGNRSPRTVLLVEKIMPTI